MREIEISRKEGERGRGLGREEGFFVMVDEEDCGRYREEKDGNPCVRVFPGGKQGVCVL